MSTTFHKYEITYISLKDNKENQYVFNLTGYIGDEKEFMEHCNKDYKSQIVVTNVKYLGEETVEFKK